MPGGLVEEFVAGGRAQGLPLGLIAVRVGRPMDWRAPSMIQARCMAGISLPIQYSSSDTRWGGNHRYPLTTRCFRFEPDVSLPTPLVQQQHYALLSQPLGRSRPYREFSSTVHATLRGHEENWWILWAGLEAYPTQHATTAGQGISEADISK